MITIIDYGMGNLRSVQKAFEHIGRKAVITDDKNRILNSSMIVLPGVGSFDAAMHNLKKTGLAETIRNFVKSGRPFLGLCLGLQVLFEKSEEGNASGLGLLKGCVKKFRFSQLSRLPKLSVGQITLSSRLKIPHMGWNNVHVTAAGKYAAQKKKIFRKIENDSYFYFVHSYYIEPEDKNIISSATFYGKKFASSVLCGNIFATQFHPEKSQKNGLNLLRNYADYTGN